MSKKKEDKWTQIDNFLFGVEKGAHGQRLVLKSVTNDWRIMWDENTMMFVTLTGLIADEKCHPYVKGLVALFYATTAYTHDLVSLAEKQETPLMNGFAKLLEEEAEFEASLIKEPAKEKDDEVLQNVIEMENVKAEIEKLDEEIKE